MSFLAALDAEIAALQAGLDTDPRMVKLRELRRVRALYAKSQGEPTGDVVETDQRHTKKLMEMLAGAHTQGGYFQEAFPLLTPRAGRPPSPERKRALDAAREFLRDKTSPVRTAMIFDHLRRAGITIGGTDPQNNLSAMLSNSDDFQSHGRFGWTLVRTIKEPAE